MEDPDKGNCEGACSPTVINIGVSNDYKFSSAADGVVFDIDGDGVLDQVAWPTEPADVVFLAIDRDGHGVINNGAELFGSVTVPGRTTGFSALQALVESNGDGIISSGDVLFSSLVLWSDVNRNGISEASELIPASQHLAKVGLSYRQVGRRDQHGNSLRYQGYAVTIKDHGAGVAPGTHARSATPDLRRVLARALVSK